MNKIMYLPKRMVHSIPSEQVFCYRHPDTELIDDCETGDIICPNCGLVLVDRLSNVNVDCASFTKENKKIIAERVGCSENWMFEGSTNLSTLIRHRKGIEKSRETDSK